jgi:membrane-bound serine protease (ClpP class)
MVDKTVSVPDYKSPNGFLVLTTADALRSHMADAQADTLADALRIEHLENAPIIHADYTWGEQLARFATDPVVTSILLTIGMLGLVLEMQTMHGIAGTIGVLAFALFFGTHIYAGFSNGLVVALAIAGVIGILWELHVVPGHGAPGILGGVALLAALAIAGVIGILWELHVVPGHGAPGILGGVALLAAILLAFGIPFFFVAVESVSTAVILTVITFVLMLRVFPENQWIKRLALVAAQGSDYVASRDFTEFRGATGTAASYLRPAGIGAFEGKRVDVLTEGEFIQAGTPIRVTRVEGARIFVEPVTLPSYK